MNSQNNEQQALLVMKGITKSFPGVLACDNVDFSVNKGEVHALIGENGAGKSTLIKVLSGSQPASSGEIWYDGRTLGQYSPLEAMKIGISVIYQEFNLFPEMMVYENIFFGKEKTAGGMVDVKAMVESARNTFQKLGMGIDPKALVKNLSIAEQQMTEIAKAVTNEVKLIVMDEPSATLTNKELEHLFTLIRKLREEGTSIIYISHRMEEIFEIADRVTVMRDGKCVATKQVSQSSRDELIRLMVGRAITSEYPYEPGISDELALEVTNLCSDKVRNASLTVKKGEVVGIAGLVGAGRTELARALFGADRAVGEIKVNGRPVRIRSPKDAIAAGIVLLPEDRKQHGLLLRQTILDNVTFTVLGRYAKLGFWVDDKRCEAVTKKYIDVLRIKTPSLKQTAGNLSGGNQQKVVLAKWLATESNILIFDEPTRGIDVGAKREIYEIIADLKRQGKSIIMISSELPEIIGMSDRVYVMYRGHVAGELQRSEISQEHVLKIAVGEEGKLHERA